MWTVKNRGRYDRGKLRYPSDLTDSEWELAEPLIPPSKRGGGKRTVVMGIVTSPAGLPSLTYSRTVRDDQNQL